jgi:hypothetical protein
VKHPNPYVEDEWEWEPPVGSDRPTAEVHWDERLPRVLLGPRGEVVSTTGHRVGFAGSKGPARTWRRR